MIIRLDPVQHYQMLSLVYKSTPNGLRTKCAYVWTGLRTCTAPSVNGSHIICHEPKFVGFLWEHKENWMRRVSFLCTGCPSHAPGVLCSPQVCEKLINRTPLMHRMQMAQRVSSTLVYTKLKVYISTLVLYRLAQSRRTM